MNIRRAWRRLRRPYEYEAQRDRRIYLERLAQITPAPAPVAYGGGARVDIRCLCGHTYSQHVVVSAGQATCLGPDTCVIFRPAGVQVTPAS